MEVEAAMATQVEAVKDARRWKTLKLAELLQGNWY